WPGAALFETHSAAESFAWWIVRVETRSFRREPRWVERQGRSKESLRTALRNAAEQAWRTARQGERAKQRQRRGVLLLLRLLGDNGVPFLKGPRPQADSVRALRLHVPHASAFHSKSS